jgi:3-hydroxyisobutyrate dehydrogenase-like beta-hydroxyacid dehydrogenase
MRGVQMIGDVQRVGFVGLGDQGAPMARAIAQAGWPLSVWARRPASLAAVAGVEHSVCADLTELGRSCDLVGLCLRDDGDVRDVLLDRGLLAAMRPGSIIANHGTGSPEESELLESEGRRCDVVILDAPVSGGRAAAEAKTLTAMVGGDRDAFERARPVFASFSAVVTHLGPTGAGQFAKLMNNVLFAANLANAAAFMALADQLGFDTPALVDLVRTSSGRSFALDAIAEHIKPDLVGHYQDIVSKDIEHFGHSARRRGAPRSSLEGRAEAGVRQLRDAVASVNRS